MQKTVSERVYWRSYIIYRVSIFLKKHCAKYEDKNLAKKYRPTSVLPTLSKVVEKTIQKQVINYVNTFQGLN